MSSGYRMNEDDFMEIGFSPSDRSLYESGSVPKAFEAAYGDNLLNTGTNQPDSYYDDGSFQNSQHTDYSADCTPFSDEMATELLHYSAVSAYNQNILFNSPCHCEQHSSNATTATSSNVCCNHSLPSGSSSVTLSTTIASTVATVAGSVPQSYSPYSPFYFNQSVASSLSSSSSISSLHASPSHSDRRPNSKSQYQHVYRKGNYYSQVPPHHYTQPYRHISPASFDLLRQMYGSNYQQMGNLIDIVLERIDRLHDLDLKSHHKKPRELIELNILLPNGYFITMTVYDDITLKEIKHELWIRLRAFMSKKMFAKKTEDGKEATKPIDIVSRNSKKSKLNNLINLSRSSSAILKRSSPDQTEYANFNQLLEEEQPNNSSSQSPGRRVNILSSLMNRLRQNNLTIDEQSIFDARKLLNVRSSSLDDYSLESDVSTLSFLREDLRDFTFQSITLNAKIKEFDNDDRQLADLNLFLPYLRLVEVVGNKAEKSLSDLISSTIGKPLSELDSIRLDEFRSYRQWMYHCMVKSVKDRESLPIEKRILFEFPPELDEIGTMTLSGQRVSKLDACISNINRRRHTVSLSSFDADCSHRPDSNPESFTCRPEMKRTMNYRKPQPEDQPPLYTEVIAMPVSGGKQFTCKDPGECATYMNIETHPPVLISEVNKQQQHVIEEPLVDEVEDEEEDEEEEEEEEKENIYPTVTSTEEDVFNFRKPYNYDCMSVIWANSELFSSIIVTQLANKYESDSQKPKDEAEYSEIVFEDKDTDCLHVKVSDESTDLEGKITGGSATDVSSITVEKNGKLKRKRSFIRRLFNTKQSDSGTSGQQNIGGGGGGGADSEYGNGSGRSSSGSGAMLFTFNSETNSDCSQLQEFQIEINVQKQPSELLVDILRQILRSPELFSDQAQISPKLANKGEVSKLKTISKFLSDKFSSNYSRLKFSSNSRNDSRLASIPALDEADIKSIESNINYEDFILKICGFEEYITGQYPLIAFEYIRNCVSKGKTPQLMLMSRKLVIENIPTYQLMVPSYIRRHSSNATSSVEYNRLPETSEVKPPPGGGDEDDEKREQGEKLYAIIDSNQISVNQDIELKLSENFSTKTLEQSTNDGNYSTISHVIPNGSQQSATTEDSNINRLQRATESDPSEFEAFPELGAESLDPWIKYGIENGKLLSLWKINKPFRIRILLATYVNVKDVEKIYVKAGLYHGNEPLCEHQSTKPVSTGNPRWDEMLAFPEISIQDIPLSARLSIALCATGQRKKPQEEFSISWINLQLFNYKRCLLAGRISLSLWPMPKNFEGFLNPMGCCGCNPNRFSSSRLQVEIDTFPSPLVFPPRSDILDYAKIVNKYELSIRRNPNTINSEDFPNKLEYRAFFSKFSIGRFDRRSESKQSVLKQLRKLISRRDLFTELTEQEKDFFWRERHIIRKIVPDALPKVLESVRWSCREEVCQMYAMLESWPTVSVDTAIILLGSRYVDSIVRSFAIRCLDQGLTDGLMIHYLLQFVQLLKNEPYYYNDLAQMLLRRSLLSRRFGNLFFWHLRSEINDPIYSIRWCVLLEMYCRGLSAKSLDNVHKQVKALEEIERVSNETINETDRLEAIMKQFHTSEILAKVTNFFNPLNITLPLGELKHNKCRVMDSAKRPLWLEWSNANQMAKYNNLQMSAIIFKSGDDLRQDMLTLQVIRIMDLIWRRENLDLKMLPYNCLATGDQVGLIEVVSHAKTVMGIQRCGGRMAALQVDSSKLHKWIKDHNQDNYDNAVDNFTRSCAGYCVATFILGIGDRNPDNIMVNENGQIFHIDFGHFLGHFKKKFGINRERVPFVLTYDFLQVISKGAENPLKSKEFEAFQRLCNDAYLALHDNSSLLITLFLMMLGTDIPELQTIDDVQYLRQTLQVDRSREDALRYFECQLDEAHGGAWSTKLDWFFHSVKHA